MRKVDLYPVSFALVRDPRLISVVVAGTITLAPSLAKADSSGMSFREFRANNPNLGKHEIRSQYRAEFSPARQRHVLTIQSSAVSSAVYGAAGNSSSTSNHVHGFRHQTFQLTESGGRASTRNGIDLNLDSDSESITLGAKLFQSRSSVTIDRGGQQVNLAAGSIVTAAEYVAVKQILSSGMQTITLDNSGKAVGGSVDLSQITARNDRMRADDLTVPVNVTAYGDFSRGSNFQILGDLVNAGSIYASDSKHSTASGAIRADNLTNTSTGLISSEATLSGTGSESNRLNLTLAANDKLINQGTIVSSGDLELLAGNAVSNSGTAAQAATISARGNVEVISQSIENHGLIRSTEGNVSLNSDSALTVDNRAGEIQALAGAINIRDRSFHADIQTYVYGGDLLSENLNVFTGRGVADLTVNKLTGVLNQKGFASHVTADTETLTLGDICLSGDPTYKNQLGDIIIGGNITVQQALTIIAGSSISNNASAVITAGDGNKGYDITFIAGADITSSGSDSSIIGPIPPVIAGVATNISGNASAFGGNILLGTDVLAPLTINARSSGGANTNGGNVLFAAFEGLSTTGTIDLTNTKINTGGRGTGSNGNVTFIAGGLGTGNTITVGGVDTTGGSGVGGDITVSGFRPQSSGGTISYNANGDRTSVGQIIASNSSSTGSNIATAGDLTAAGNITVRTGLNGNIAIGEFNVTSKGANGVVDLLVTGTGNITDTEFSTIKTRTLNLTTATGDIGDSTNNIPIFANASFINVMGNAASTDALIVSFNPGLNVVSGTAASMNIATQGTIISDPSKGAIVASELLIGSFAGGVGINSFRPLEVTADDLFVAGLGGNVFIHNNNAGTTNLTGGDSLQARGTFNLTTDGKITLASGEKIVATNVLLQPLLGFNSVQGTLRGTSSVSLITPGTIDASTVSPIVQSPVLNVTSLNGDIGSMAQRLQSGPTVTTIAAFAPNGSVYLQGPAISKAFLAGGSAGANFDYVGTNTTTITGNITSGSGDLSVVINGPGTLTVGSGVSLVSGRNMTVQLSDPLASTKQKIVIGTNASLQTNAAPGFGDIVVSVGTPSAPVTGTAPTKGVAFVEVPPNQIFWGTFGVAGKGVNTVFAKGADVQFTNTIKAGAISLSGGVVIVADPPVAVAATVSGAPETANDRPVRMGKGTFSGFSSDSKKSQIVSQSLVRYAYQNAESAWPPITYTALKKRLHH